MGLPYRLVLTVACIVLAIRYAIDTEASITGRSVIVALTIASFLAPGGLGGYVAGIVLQLAICLFVLLRHVALKSSSPRL